MNKRILIRWAMGASLPHLIVLALAVYGAWGGWHHIIVAADGVTATMAKVSGKNGTIAMADEDIGVMRSLLVHADLVARHEQQQLSIYDGYGAQLFADFHGLAGKGDTAVDAVTETANAAKGTLTQATTDLGTLNGSIAATKPLIEAGTTTISRVGVASDDLDALLKKRAIEELLDNLAGITHHGNAIAGDFQDVADKARADYLRPVKWYMQPVKQAGNIMDISAAIARHTP